MSSWKMSNAAGEDRGTLTGTRLDANTAAKALTERTGEKIYTEKDGTTVHLSDGSKR